MIFCSFSGGTCEDAYETVASAVTVSEDKESALYFGLSLSLPPCQGNGRSSDLLGSDDITPCWTPEVRFQLLHTC